MEHRLFDNIPLEMRSYAQWVLWRYEEKQDGKPTKIPYSARNGQPASVTNPDSWSTFDQAIHVLTAHNWYNGIGFVLADSDPFAFIDLDDTKGDQESSDKQAQIYNDFNSYAERSPSGKGLHIIVRGAIPTGRRRSSIEIYSRERYMTMTGDVFRNTPIADCHEELNALYVQMSRGQNAQLVYAGLAEETDTDDEIIERATQAANGEKFSDLYRGDWAKYYNSQSEGDFALVDILAFYTHNRNQITRLFHASSLGVREKAKRVDYVNYMLNKAFDRLLPQIDLGPFTEAVNAMLAAREVAKLAAPPASKIDGAPLPEPALPIPSDNIYSAPPGIVGEIAQFIYQQAPRPVPEIALVAAIALVAGIVGRAYNVSNTGLNQYVLMLAPTGTGKEAMARGIDKLMGQVQKTVAAAVEFIGPGEIASSQALIKYMSNTASSFVSTVGEFGIYLQQMASTNAPPHLIGLRRMLLDLYNKSGQGNILRPSIYSDKDKNTTAVHAPAFTLLGESTPEKFYEGLHEGMISEGLLPRFTIVEYHGERPPLNEGHAYVVPSPELVERLATLCAHALALNRDHKVITVAFDDQAKRTFDQFDAHCDMQIRAADREVRRHLWNRAHVKAMKLAAVIAVGNNPYIPMITAAEATWAINVVMADVRNLLARFEIGEIGIDNDETKQLAKVVATVKDYLTLPWSEVSKYCDDGGQAMHGERIVPYAYVQRRNAAVAVFRKDRQGASAALKRALKTLTERGDLQEVSRATLQKSFGKHSLAFAVSNPKMFA